MNRSEWLKTLQQGSIVLLTRPRKAPQEMYVRFVDERHIFMVPANEPKSDLAHGEVVWSEDGEGPFGEMIYPLDEGVKR